MKYRRAHTQASMKNKTLSAWLAFAGGPVGLHRFYLYGLGDALGWIHGLPTALGLYGVHRVQVFGLDDPWSWLLIPCAGFLFASTALTAIVYGLMSPEQWNARFNPTQEPQSAAGQTTWLTVGAVVLALMVGATALMSSLAFSFEHFFVYQIEESRKISQ
jgi:hypothetical protein